MSDDLRPNRCRAIGSMSVGGIEVAAFRCELDAGHERPIPVWLPSVPVEKRRVSSGFPMPIRYLEPTRHRYILEWADAELEILPSHELFDPDERFDNVVPIDPAACHVCGRPAGEPHDEPIHALYV